MQIFELHFNPKNKEGHFFDGFIFEPQNIYEKKLGSLYLVGDLPNALPQNSKLLEKLAREIKGKYYTISFKHPEKSMSESLKAANDFLQKEVRNENVSWLGNLNFASLSIKDFNLIFAKTGAVKILLQRGGQITDIGKNLDFEEMDPYPLKIFFNMLTGKLAPDDIVFILTNEIYDFFSSQKIFKNFCSLESLDEKKLKEILPPSLLSEGQAAKISGICFLISFTRETPAQEASEKQSGVDRKQKKLLFQKQSFLPLAEIFSFLKKPLKLKIKTPGFFKKISEARKKAKKFNFLKTAKPKKTAKNKKTGAKNKKFVFQAAAKELLRILKEKKQIRLLLILALILLIGLLIF